MQSRSVSVRPGGDLAQSAPRSESRGTRKDHRGLLAEKRAAGPGPRVRWRGRADDEARGHGWVCEAAGPGVSGSGAPSLAAAQGWRAQG